MENKEEFDELIDKCWKEFRETIQESEYMARLNLKRRELDFKAGALAMYDKLKR